MKCKIVSIIALLAVMVALTGAASAVSSRFETNVTPHVQIDPIHIRNGQQIFLDLNLSTVNPFDIGHNATTDPILQSPCIAITVCDINDISYFRNVPIFLVNADPMIVHDQLSVTANVPLNRSPGTGYPFTEHISLFATSSGVSPADTVILAGGFISGKKCNDLAGTGVCGAGQPGLPNWTIVLRNDTGAIVDTTQTDANGNYIFKGQLHQGAFLGFRGNFTVEEVLLPGWTQTGPPSPGTYSITVDANDLTGLDFANRQSSNITVVKNTVGGDGTFNYTTTGGDGLPSSLSVTTSSGTGSQTFTNITPGNYSISEIVPSGWSLTSSSCSAGSPSSFVAPPGGNVTCTFNNAIIPGTITVVKNTVGGDGTFNFNTTGEDGLPPSLSVSTSGGTGSQTFTNITPGTYSISEIVPPEWTLTSSSCSAGMPSSFAVPPGGNVTCTFNNAKQNGTIIVVKNTVGGDGTFNFSTTGGDGFPSSLSVSTSNGTGSQMFGNITSGTYSISENMLPSGWTLTSSSCSAGSPSSFDVPPGGTVTCTFNNALVITHPGKSIGWGDLGSKASFNFWVKSAFLSTGTMTFTDKINKVEIKATRIDSMTTHCNELACTTFSKSGTMKGMADVTENGAKIGNFAFTVDVVDNADPSHGQDTFSISVPDYKPLFMPSGYSMSGAVTFGNLKVVQTS